MDQARVEQIRRLIVVAKRWDTFFVVLGIMSMMFGVLMFVTLFVAMGMKGFSRIDWEFFTSFPSRHAAKAGILSAWVGTILVMLVTAMAAIPVGVAAVQPRSMTQCGKRVEAGLLMDFAVACWHWACSSISSALGRASCQLV